MNLKDVDDHPTGRGQLLMAHMALEMLCFLVLDQNLLALKLTLTIITPY